MHQYVLQLQYNVRKDVVFEVVVEDVQIVEVVVFQIMDIPIFAVLVTVVENVLHVPEAEFPGI